MKNLSGKNLLLFTLIFWVVGVACAYFATGGFGLDLPYPKLLVLGGLLLVVGIITFFMGIVAFFRKEPKNDNSQN